METVFNQSLWGDEGFSAILSMKPFFDIFRIISRDTSPPLWNVFEWLIFKLFGTGEIYIRSLSFIFFLGTVFFVFKIGTLLWNKKTGLLSAVLTFFNPFFFMYAFEGRMYSIMSMGVAGSMYFFLKVQRSNSAKGITKKQPPDNFGYVFFTLWALYSHHFAIFLLFVQGLWFLYEFFFGLRRNSILIFKLFLVVTLGYIPWLYPLYTQTKQVAGGFWLGTPTLKDLRNLIYEYLAEGIKNNNLKIPYLKATYYHAGLYLVFAVLLVRRWTKDIKKSLFLLSWFLGPIVLTWLISQKMQSIFYNRYLLYTIPAAMLIIASIRSKFTTPFVFALILFFTIIDFDYFTHPRKLPFRRFSAEVKTEVRNGDYLINWNSNGTHHVWETKYYGIPAPIYIPPNGGSLPFFVGTALMDKGDIVSEIPSNIKRVGAITSGPDDEVKIAGFSQTKVFTYGKLNLVWLERNK